MDGSEIRRRRKVAGLSQGALASSVGVTQATISTWERGQATPRPEHVPALERALDPAIPGSAAASASQNYGEWLRTRRDELGLTREDLAGRAGISAVGIWNIETGRTTSPRAATRQRLESALEQQAPARLVRAVEKDAEIRGVGQMSSFDPHDEDDFPREPGVYVLYDISERPIYVGQSRSIKGRLRQHQDKFWYRQPIVETAAYVRVDDDTLRGQLEETLIKFLKSNAVVNQRLVDR